MSQYGPMGPMVGAKAAKFSHRSFAARKTSKFMDGTAYSPNFNDLVAVQY
jgi:hypothetical protein